MFTTSKDPPNNNNPLLNSAQHTSNGAKDSSSSSSAKNISKAEQESNAANSSSGNPVYAYNKFVISNFAFPMNPVPYALYPTTNLSAFSAPMTSQPLGKDPIAALAPLTAAVVSSNVFGGFGYTFPSSQSQSNPEDEKQKKKKRKKPTTAEEHDPESALAGGADEEVIMQVVKTKKPKAVTEGDGSQTKAKRKKKTDNKETGEGLHILCAAMGIQQPGASSVSTEAVKVSSAAAVEGGSGEALNGDNKIKREKMKHPKIQASISNKLEVAAREELQLQAEKEAQKKDEASHSEPRKVVGMPPSNDFHDDLAVGMTEEYIPSEQSNSSTQAPTSSATSSKTQARISFPSTDTFDSSYVRKLKIHENGDLIESSALYRLMSQESSQEKTLKLLLPTKASFDSSSFTKTTLIEEHRKVIPYIFDGVLDANIEVIHERVISPLKYWDYLKAILDASSPIAKCLNSEHVESSILHINSCSEAEFEHSYMGENVVKWNTDLLLYQKSDFQDEKSYHNFLLIMRTFRSCVVILRKKMLDSRCFISHTDFGILMKEVIEDVISEKKRVKRNDIYHAVRESYHLLHGISNTMMAAYLLKLPKSTKCLVLRCCKWLLLTGHTITFGGGGSIFSKIVDRLLEKITKH